MPCWCGMPDTDGRAFWGRVHNCFKLGRRMVLIREETPGGGSGYDQPSPSIPLPVEGRGKPVATRSGILGALAASVTYCKSRHLHNLFLKSVLSGSTGLAGVEVWMA